MLRDFKEILKFFIFNVGLPLFDMATDLQAFIIYFFYDDHPNWAFLTLFWIFNPFIMHSVKFIAAYFYYKTGKPDWFHLFLHFPFVLPLRNFYLTFQLYKLRFGMDDFNSKDWAAVEAIQTEVAGSGLSESYYEAGPQVSDFFTLVMPDPVKID